MSDNNKKSLIKSTSDFISSNVIRILIIFALIFSLFLSFQIYNYFNLKNIKNTSANFFNSIQNNDIINENLENIKDENTFYSVLSSLKLIDQYNINKNFEKSSEIYKNLVDSNKLNLDPIYLTAISVHAAYTLIDASYIKNNTEFLDDIKFFIDSISNNLKNYFPIKKELEYLYWVTEIDLKKLDYSKHEKVIEMYNFIYESNLISSSIKERVKKIHEFQLYK